MIYPDFMFRKTKKILLCAFFVALPFQVRLILFSYTKPFNEWTSGFLYLSDLLLVGLLGIWFWECFKEKRIPKFYIHDLFLLGFVALAALSIFEAGALPIAAFRFIKLAEMAVFYIYVRDNLSHFAESAPKFIIASGVIQGVIAIAQYFAQSAIGLGWLGESPIKPGAYGVASFYIGAKVFLRSYGMTPHPNILALWMFIALIAFIYWYLAKKPKLSVSLALAAPMIFGFYFTFSRTTLAIWALSFAVLSIIFIFLKRGLTPDGILRFKKLFLIIVAVSILFAALFFPQVKARINLSSQDEAVTYRIYYNKLAESITKSSPVIGIGIGQFVYKLMKTLPHNSPYVYQPAHNMYLLISSEIGIPGLVLFAAFILFVLIRRLKSGLSKIQNILALTLCLGILIIAFFDHPTWTSQQGSLIFGLALGAMS
ncbi:MAG: hypothetical protein CEN90_27 [Parcubacteria group bacterium Licking1014_17]|nr:MAG: hypothetical protein CEN90_27 [Parcubacteria group bacterium Licking1014_17]